MSKRVIINLVGGSLETGFRAVTAQVSTMGDARSLDSSMQFHGSLPPAPDLVTSYRRWQLLCGALYQRQSRSFDDDFEIEEDDITHISEIDFEELNQQFKTQLNDWLNAPTFANIDRKLRTGLNANDELRIIIETDDDITRRLPWHLWHFLEDYPRSEVALGCWERGKISQSQTASGAVRILAVLGSSEGIDIQTDRHLLSAISGLELTWLETPKRSELNEALWDDRGWDILFFAGHSRTEGETGRIYINDRESLTIPQLKYALQTAIERGLQLAIFNSCDGLGLARQLADLQIPQTIVMREPVPDRVAQEFLEYFLAAFAGGTSFFLAVRQARERLQGLESEFPGASWLPVICQNPDRPPPTWKSLTQPPPKWGILPRWRWGRILAATAIATLAIVGVRSLGWLEIWELQAYDRLLRQRPPEPPDDRLLVVEATEADLSEYGFPLPDEILDRTLERLEALEPATIGLDIYRDRPVGEGRDSLIARLEGNSDAIVVCSTQVPNNPKKPGVPPPPEMPESQVGFSDVIKDADGLARRHLMFLQPHHASPCLTNFALSSQLALHYLATQDIEAETIPPKQVRIGKVLLKPLTSRSGAYQNLDDRGFQMMLNYRLPAVARRVRLGDVLAGNLEPEWVRNRIVLIGITSPISADYFYTPNSAAQLPYKTLPGVLLQAQMTSQIVSAVEDGRSLVWWLPLWGECLWVGGWAFVGGCTIGGDRNGFAIALRLGIATGGLYGTCWLLLVWGGWMPLVPSALALLLGSGGSGALQSGGFDRVLGRSKLLRWRRSSP